MAVSQEWGSVGVRVGMDVVGFLGKRRDELGLTQGELAGRVDKSGAWLSMVEGGSRELLVSDLLGLLKALGVEDVVLFIKS